MKIVLFTPYYFPILGGYTIITHNLYGHFRKMGHEVIIITPKVKDVIEGTNVYFLENCHVSIIDRISNSKSYYISQRFLGFILMSGIQKKAIELIKEIQPDVVHTFGAAKYAYIGAMCVSNRTRWVHTFITQYNQHLSYIKRLLIKSLFRKVDLVTVTAENQKEELEFMIGPKIDKVIEVGVDTDLFMPQEKISNNLCIGAVSNFVWFKKVEGVILLIKAFKKVVSIQPHARLLIVGDGEHRNWLEKVINELHLASNVYLVGTLNQKQLSLFYNNIDVFAHISFQDTMPLTVLEAMASGLPVVASKVGAIPDMVDETVGYITDFNEEDIADMLLKLLNSEDLRITMGKNARKRALDKYSWVNISQKYLEAYINLRRNKE